MPILPPSSGGSPSQFNTTVQNIIDGTAQDIRQQIGSTGSPGQAILVDYCNRVSLQLLRLSRWQWLLSPIQRFVTQMEVSDYWFGATGTNPTGTWDTGLNISSLLKLREDSLFDRTNMRRLLRTDEQPNLKNLVWADASPRKGQPKVYRNDPATPFVLNLYPTPDNQTTYQPQPESPAVTTASGGSLGSRVYYVNVTFVDSLGGESVPADNPAKIWIPANSLLVVQPPIEPINKGATGIKYDRFNVYTGTTSSNLTKQASNQAITGNWTEPTGGLIAGAPPPSASTVESIDGYVIEFRYYISRIQLTDPSQILQIPDDYKDVVISGVNQLAFQYLNRPREAGEWKMLYREGLTSIIHDKNLFPAGSQFIHPDAASVQSGIPFGTEIFDFGTLT